MLLRRSREKWHLQRSRLRHQSQSCDLVWQLRELHLHRDYRWGWLPFHQNILTASDGRMGYELSRQLKLCYRLRSFRSRLSRRLRRVVGWYYARLDHRSTQTDVLWALPCTQAHPSGTLRTQLLAYSLLLIEALCLTRLASLTWRLLSYLD